MLQVSSVLSNLDCINKYRELSSAWGLLYNQRLISRAVQLRDFVLSASCFFHSRNRLAFLRNDLGRWGQWLTTFPRRTKILWKLKWRLDFEKVLRSRVCKKKQNKKTKQKQLFFNSLYICSSQSKRKTENGLMASRISLSRRIWWLHHRLKDQGL